ncbi:hypothetical protein ACHGLA_35005 [Streptomyces sp. YH02]|uniref:hypothetical protein n=1 Tax=Streptomyces sp. YH02 TaxID=3256999 RepID=UPI003756ACFF
MPVVMILVFGIGVAMAWWGITPVSGGLRKRPRAPEKSYADSTRPRPAPATPVTSV